jgi:hypothetical protein
MTSANRRTASGVLAIAAVSALAFGLDMAIRAAVDLLFAEGSQAEGITREAFG